MAVFVILGVIFLVVAIFFALPISGTGAFTGGLGDIFFDIPIALFCLIASIFFFFLGGVLQLIVDYWWLALIGVVVYILFFTGKVWRISKTTKRR